jgi:hypothetical protein
MFNIEISLILYHVCILLLIGLDHDFCLSQYI